MCRLLEGYRTGRGFYESLDEPRVQADEVFMRLRQRIRMEGGTTPAGLATRLGVSTKPYALPANASSLVPGKQPHDQKNCGEQKISGET